MGSTSAVIHGQAKESGGVVARHEDVEVQCEVVDVGPVPGVVRPRQGHGPSQGRERQQQIALQVGAQPASARPQGAERAPSMAAGLVCDDASLARAAVRHACASVPGVDHVSSPGSGEQVLARCPVERPSVVLMDVRLRGMGGVEATRVRRLLETYPGAVVVMLTLGEDIDGIAAAMAVGARGMVKDASGEETATLWSLVATAPVHQTDNVVSLPVRPSSGGPCLSGREVKVLEGMSRGKSNAQIGRELYVAEDTVKTHARRMFRKMGPPTGPTPSRLASAGAC